MMRSRRCAQHIMREDVILCIRLKKWGFVALSHLEHFYVFPNIQEFGMTSEEFATELLREEKVAVVPGSAFGASGEGYIRISYAYSLDDLKEALGRVNHFIEKLRKK